MFTTETPTEINITLHRDTRKKILKKYVKKNGAETSTRYLPARVKHRRLLPRMRINSPKFTDLTKNCSKRGKREVGGSRICCVRPSSKLEDQFVKPIMNESFGSL